ncbi:PREDICTED: hemicentin-2-like isoform X2 [Priapulus caudatus]|uniref:Hemicentin-2-like isoform X2 n=1 Tax=Priapulus caudatus TaxID=37621 RepID=A0ABM1EMH9_PRICU|nr:PREDICTED: hemicentin-2-like isoform X2 [Priapulus caudatus]
MNKTLVLGTILTTLLSTVCCQFLKYPVAKEVERGGNVTLECQFDPTVFNVKSAKRYWYRYDGMLIDDTFQLERYTLQSNGDTGAYNLRIARAQYAEDNQRFSCRAQLAAGKVHQSEPVQLTVLTPPGDPRVTVTPSTTVNEGDKLSLRCESAGGSPPPTIVWYSPKGVSVDGVYVAGNVNSPTVSTITIEASRDDHRQEYHCEVYNKVNEQNKKVIKQGLSVKYQPYVTVTPEFKPLRLELGSQSALTCDVNANPPAQYVKWFKDGSELADTTFDYALNPVTVDHTGVYRCEATNHLGTGRAEITIEVQYAPRVKTPERIETSEGGNVEITCNVDAYPAPAKIEWWRDGLRVAEIATLKIAKIVRTQGGNYTCKVTSFLQLSLEADPVTRTSESHTYVQVSYKPGVAVIESVEAVLVGDSPVISCTATDYGVPRGEFEWHRSGETNVIWRGSSYQPGSVRLSDNGAYECVLRNSLGLGTGAHTQLTVNQLPELNAFPPAVIKQNESYTGLFVTCGARGKPAPVIQWFKDGQELTIGQEGTRLFTSVINTTQVDTYISETTGTLWWRGPSRAQLDKQRSDNALIRTDNGNYECRAIGAGKEVSHTLRLIVNFAPVVVQNITKFAYTSGDTGTVVCHARAVPEPVFTWYKQQGGHEIQQSDRISLNTAQPDADDKYESRLVVKGVDKDDLGNYRCRVKNLMGETEVVLKLQQKSRPDPPVALKVENVTSDSAALKWEPGFDGGDMQKFVVKFNWGDHVSNMDVDPPTATRFTVEGLQPSTQYNFVVQAKNAYGVSDVSNGRLLTTEEKPFSPDDVVLADVGFNEVSKKLSWSPPPSSANLCVKVEKKRENDWMPNGPCVPMSDGSLSVDDYTSGTVMRASVCMSGYGQCGTPTEAKINFYMYVLIVIVVLVGVLIIVSVVIIVCCCRRKSRTKKAAKAKQDYEMEAAHARAPATYSVPPQYADTSIHKGVTSGSMDYGEPHKDVPYHIGNGYGNSSGSGGGGYGNGNGGYGNGSGYGNSSGNGYYPNYNGGPPPAYNGHGSTASDIYKPDPWDAEPLFSDGDLNRLNNSHIENPYLHVSGLPNPYDYEDYGSQAPSTNITYDNNSVPESGYSTPNHPQRKVIHEVIV